MEDSADVESEVKSTNNREVMLKDFSSIIGADINSNLPPAALDKIISIASSRLAESPLGLEGGRDVLAIISATLASEDPKQAQEVLAQRAGLKLEGENLTPKRRMEIVRIALDRLVPSLGVDSAKAVLALVATSIAKPHDSETLKFFDSRANTKLKLDTPANQSRQVIEYASSQLGETPIGIQGSQGIMAIVATSLEL
jgi:hypothetical protein